MKFTIEFDNLILFTFQIPAKPNPLFDYQRLNLSKFILDVKHFSSKDEQAKAEDMYKQLMGKEKELKDMLKEKVKIYI